MQKEVQNIKPISHKGFKHLNKRITILGYPPLVGGLLLVLAIMLPVFSFAFKSPIFMGITAMYLTVLMLYTKKNMRRVKEKKLEMIDVIFIAPKLRAFNDPEGVINQILKK